MSSIPTYLWYLVRGVPDIGTNISLVNNAGICTEANNPQPIDEVDEEGFDAHLRINTRGVFLGCKYAVRQFKKQELHPCGVRGWIVNFASMVANIGMAGLSELPEDDPLSRVILTLGSLAQVDIRHPKELWLP